MTDDQSVPVPENEVPKADEPQEEVKADEPQEDAPEEEVKEDEAPAE